MALMQVYVTFVFSTKPQFGVKRTCNTMQSETWWREQRHDVNPHKPYYAALKNLSENIVFRLSIEQLSLVHTSGINISHFRIEEGTGAEC